VPVNVTGTPIVTTLGGGARVSVGSTLARAERPGAAWASAATGTASASTASRSAPAGLVLCGKRPFDIAYTALRGSWVWRWGRRAPKLPATHDGPVRSSLDRSDVVPPPYARAHTRARMAPKNRHHHPPPIPGLTPLDPTPPGPHTIDPTPPGPHTTHPSRDAPRAAPAPPTPARSPQTAREGARPGRARAARRRRKARW
jgi:pyruvate/2-oxoglutarate dehydrogenase complex dihydrolipoamide acyltransferase (E2) component